MHVRKSQNNSFDKGDTLVEVLFATATAALLIIITLVLMNRNLAQIQMSVETTFVRQAIDGQAEVLRYMRDQYMDDKGAEFSDPPANTKPTVAKLWKDLVDKDRPANRTQLSATDFGVCQPDAGGTVNAPASNKAFYINTAVSGEAEGDAVNIKDIKQYDAGNNLLKDISGASISQTYARPGQGIWIEAVNPDFGDRSNRYVDFHIRACWDPPFNGEKATLGTIVRLYYETPIEVGAPGFVTFCNDTIDNDGDGLNNSNDPGCHSDGNAGNAASYVASDNNERDPPLINLFSNTSQPIYYPPGPNNALIQWNNPGGTAVSCTSPNFPAAKNPPSPSGGSFNTGTLTSDTTYSITCFNSSSDSSTNTLLINVEPAPACMDGSDNDGDGLIDLSDPGCTTALDDDEYNYIPPPRDALYRCYQYYNGGGNYTQMTNHLYMAYQGGVGYGCYPGVNAFDPQVNYEGIQGYVPRGTNPGAIPIYGGFNITAYDSFYTSDYSEYVGAHNAGWNMASGFQFYAYPYPCTVAGTTPLYRWWSSFVGNHVYTTGTENPNNYAGADGGGTFAYEGITACIFSGTNP